MKTRDLTALKKHTGGVGKGSVPLIEHGTAQANHSTGNAGQK